MDNTVLILGAGFSKPYGYPLGSKLVEDIIKKDLYSNNPDERKLSEDLKYHGATSIDRFLSENPQHLEVGRRKIISAIHEAEKTSLHTVINSDEDIIRLLLNEVDHSKFEKLRIITFNYDRLLEWRILKKLRTSLSAFDAQKVFSKLMILHIHGRMPTLSELESTPEKVFNYNYGLENTPIEHKKWVLEKLENYAESFNTIYTADSKPDEFAVDSIKWAKRVFFLGFAYDSLNMAKLGINVDGITYDWEGKYVAGTAQGIRSIQLNQIQTSYPFLKERLIDTNAKNFFVDHFSLTVSQLDSFTLKVKKRTCCETYAIQERPVVTSDTTGFSRNLKCNTCQKNFTPVYSRSPYSSKWLVQV